MILLLQACQRLPAVPLTAPVDGGMPYLQARRELLAKGWSPLRRHAAVGCEDVMPDRRCSLFPELQACSHTGLGLCRFEWQSPDGRNLVVITADGDPSGDPGVVHRWFSAP
jgi:hypothetical protein